MTILVAHCRQVNATKLWCFHKRWRQSVDLVLCNSLKMSSNMKRKVFVTRPDVSAAGLNMLKERWVIYFMWHLIV
jgi:hypothetical protein